MNHVAFNVPADKVRIPPASLGRKRESLPRR